MPANFTNLVQAAIGHQVFHKASLISVAAVALQLAEDGHHYLPFNDRVNKLVSEHDQLYTDLATKKAGVNNADMKSILLHDAVHSLDAQVFLTWGATTHVAAHLKSAGLEHEVLPLETAVGDTLYIARLAFYSSDCITGRWFFTTR